MITKLPTSKKELAVFYFMMKSVFKEAKKISELK